MIIYLIRSLSPVPLHFAGSVCTCAGQWNLRHELKIPGQKVKDLFVGVHTLKWVELRFHSLLTSTIDGHECSALRPGRSTPGERIPHTHFEGNWVSSRTSLDIRVMLICAWLFIPSTCRYTTYGSSMPRLIIKLQLKAFIRKSRYTIIRHIRTSGSFIRQSALRQVHNLFQTEFSTECDLVLPLSIFSVLSFP